jgi:hypothetical protein
LQQREEIDVSQALRDKLDPSAFDLVLAEEVWRGFASCYGVRPGQLRITDRFDTELKVPSQLYDDENSCVNVLVSNVARRRHIEPDYASMSTLKDCVVALCRTPPSRSETAS